MMRLIALPQNVRKVQSRNAAGNARALRTKANAVLVVAIIAAAQAGVFKSARAEPVPLPVPKPRTAPAAAPLSPTTAPGISTSETADSQPSDGTCMAALRAAGITFAAASGRDKRAECSITEAVQISEVRAGTGTIAFPARPVLSCRFALQFADWATALVVPMAAGTRSGALHAIDTGPGQECRTRNNQPGAKMSAHATGEAIDVAAFLFDGGQRVAVDGTTDTGFLSSLRKASCGWFTTILGPGSDAAHSHHWHLDNIQHGSSLNYRICQ